MSKTGKILNRFFLHCLCSAAMLMPAYAQSVDLGSSGVRLRSIDTLGSADSRRNQLSRNQSTTSSQRNDNASVPIRRPSIDITQTRAPQQRAQPAATVTNTPPVQSPFPVARQPQNPLPEGLPPGSRANVATPPAQTGTPAIAEPDPFGPTGFRLGTFEANASLEQAIGYSSNVSSRAGGDSGAFSETSATLNLTSNWSRHEWQTNINGSYRRPFDDEEVDQPQLLFDSSLRLDLIDGFTLTTRGFYNLSTQGFTSSTLAPGAVDNPLQQSYGGSVELQRTDRKLQVSLRGEINRNSFEDAQLGDGFLQPQSDRNNTEYTGTARVGYEVSPALTPFLQASYGVREFDEEIDRNGNQRDSSNLEVGGGVEIDLGEKLTGEIALSYINESFEDPDLEDLSGFALNGSLNWSPQRDTQVNLTLGTQTNTSITTNENGSLIYTGRIDAEKQISNRLSVNAFADAQIETNDDRNTTLQVGFGTQYWVNRFTAITTQIDHQKFTSDAPASDFDATSGQVGIRLQR